MLTADKKYMIHWINQLKNYSSFTFFYCIITDLLAFSKHNKFLEYKLGDIKRMHVSELKNVENADKSVHNNINLTSHN